MKRKRSGPRLPGSKKTRRPKNPSGTCIQCQARLRPRRSRGATVYLCPNCDPPRKYHSEVIIRCTKCDSRFRPIIIEGVKILICKTCIGTSHDQSPILEAPPAVPSTTAKGTLIPDRDAQKPQQRLQEYIPPIPIPPARAEKPTLHERIRQPHILAQMMQSAAGLSGKAQTDFLSVIEELARELRIQLEETHLIVRIELNHKRVWEACRGKKIGFIDGGMAAMATLGAAPVAIRIGSYLVRPGHSGSEREKFDFEVQLVEELYESARRGGGFYDDIYEDVHKLHDVARISLEAAGAFSLIRRESPDLVFVHGALVNPVSMYAGEGFPDFSKKGLELILPEGERERTGGDANFVRVHLRQLELLADSGTPVCGVVERASGSRIVSNALLEELVRRGGLTAQDHSIIWERLVEYQISDGLLFECLLEEGECLDPIPVDRNIYRPGRVPEQWMPDLRRYPRPLISYIKPSTMSLPIRVELFESARGRKDEILDLLIHASRLLPRYAFPVGLDIVDKHAKIPAWMAKPVSAYLSAQIMRKALDTKNPVLINEVRRMLCGTGREWLLRPTFDREGR